MRTTYYCIYLPYRHIKFKVLIEQLETKTVITRIYFQYIVEENITIRLM